MMLHTDGDIRRLDMNEVNRGVLALKPKEKFLAWVNASDEEGVVLTLDEAKTIDISDAGD